MAVFVSVLFSLYNFVLAYNIEDEFFNRLIQDETQHITDNYLKSGALIKPRQSFMRVYSTIEEAPDEFQELYRAKPGREEYAGPEGRHYHVTISQTEPKFFLVAEVSEYLMVRPLTKGLLIFLGLSSLIMILIACLVGYWLANKSLKPLSKLAGLVEQAGPDNLPISFAHEFTQSEIGILAHSLESAMNRIRTFLEREQNFTRDASHELRTPIAVIKGAIELFNKQHLTHENAELIQRIQTAVVQMEQTVSTLLALAREEGESSKAESVLILPLVEQTIIQNAYLLEGKSVEVKVDIPASVTVRTTPGILQILLSNLISNAFQYTSQGNVSVSYQNGRLTISDSGVGIDDTIKDNLYDTLVKGEMSQGFGIGLSIVKRLCEKQDFSIVIDSSNQGTRVDIGFSNK